jgi:hypothetical protein
MPKHTTGMPMLPLPDCDACSSLHAMTAELAGAGSKRCPPDR